MSHARLKLSLALSDNPNTRPLLNGAVEAQGVEFTATAVHPSEMFWRQLKFAEFDVSGNVDLSLLIATSRGADAVARDPGLHDAKFFHTSHAPCAPMPASTRPTDLARQARRRTGIPADRGDLGPRRAAARMGRDQPGRAVHWSGRRPQAMAAPPAR